LRLAWESIEDEGAPNPAFYVDTRPRDILITGKELLHPASSGPVTIPPFAVKFSGAASNRESFL
jgi:hypothetical protein